MALWENTFENAANRFEAGKYISESGKQSAFPLTVIRSLYRKN
jgi:hypothetical protein